MAVPRSQASKTEVIHACHPLKLRMDSSVNLPGPSNVWSNHARATFRPAVTEGGISRSASSSRSITNLLMGRSPASWLGATNANSSPSWPMISATLESYGIVDSFGLSDSTAD